MMDYNKLYVEGRFDDLYEMFKKETGIEDPLAVNILVTDKVKDYIQGQKFGFDVVGALLFKSMEEAIDHPEVEIKITEIKIDTFFHDFDEKCRVSFILKNEPYCKQFELSIKEAKSFVRLGKRLRKIGYNLKLGTQKGNE